MTHEWGYGDQRMSEGGVTQVLEPPANKVHLGRGASRSLEGGGAADVDAKFSYGRDWGWGIREQRLEGGGAAGTSPPGDRKHPLLPSLAGCNKVLSADRSTSHSATTTPPRTATLLFIPVTKSRIADSSTPLTLTSMPLGSKLSLVAQNETVYITPAVVGTSWETPA